jgi:type III secretion protein C
MSTALATVSGTTTPTASMVPVPPSTAGGFDLGVIGDIILHKGRSFISLASLVNALQQDNDSVVIMNPKIIAQDSQQSTIFVGQNIPFTGSQVTTIGASQQTSTNIEYRDVGVNLSITPILGTNDIITMDISNDISSQIENTTSGTNLVGLQTSHTTLNARIHVPNNHFVALSGMLFDQKTHFKSSIPCLGGLPVIGAIFSENDRFDSKNNIIFFIRPTIIDSVEEFKKITDHQEALYKDQAIKTIVREEIDDGIDWVKTPDDE